MGEKEATHSGRIWTTSSWTGMVRSGLWLVNITASWQRLSSLVACLTFQVLPVGSIALAHMHRTFHEQSGGEVSSTQGCTALWNTSYWSSYLGITSW